MSRISQKTLVSLPVIFTLVGAMIWLTDIAALSKSNKIEIINHDKVLDKTYRELKEINVRLNNINEKLSRFEGRISK